MSDSDDNAFSAAGSADVSDEELSALIARLRQEPAAAKVLELMQKQGTEALRTLFQEVARKLAALEPLQREPQGGAASMTSLAGFARDREMAAKRRRELAQDIVLGALVNVENPDWNPLDPSTSKDAGSSAVLSMLKP